MTDTWTPEAAREHVRRQRENGEWRTTGDMHLGYALDTLAARDQEVARLRAALGG